MEISVRCRIGVRRPDHRKRLNIHQQNSQQGNAAQYVDRNDAFGIIDWTKGGR
jgi:hypothetical protein